METATGKHILSATETKKYAYLMMKVKLIISF